MFSSAIERIDNNNLLVHTRNSINKIDALSSPVFLTAKPFFWLDKVYHLLIFRDSYENKVLETKKSPIYLFVKVVG